MSTIYDRCYSSSDFNYRHGLSIIVWPKFSSKLAFASDKYLLRWLLLPIFSFQFKSFCSSHRPAQKMKQLTAPRPASSVSDQCSICQEEVGLNPSSESIWSPCCGAFFHPACIQNASLSAGAYHFRFVISLILSRDMVAQWYHISLTLNELWGSWFESCYSQLVEKNYLNKPKFQNYAYFTTTIDEFTLNGISWLGIPTLEN